MLKIGIIQLSILKIALERKNNMENFYTNEPDILELIALMKAHGVRNAIVSPGSTNISLAASLLYDKDIEVYSAVDERSAAYMACGLAEETGEPVAISCTGATAARNYVPALTEAYYRKLPILCLTSSQYFGRVGQHMPQVTDRTNPLNDIVKKSVQIPVAYSSEDRWSNNVKMNDAMLELKRNGGGPVHINIETSFSRIFDQKSLPNVRKIDRFFLKDEIPTINAGKVIVFVGSHSKFDDELTNLVDEFCARFNAVIVCDHTSNYKGKYRILGGLVERQKGYQPKCRNCELIIHIGEVSGAYYPFPKAPVWRVSPDGEIRDTFYGLTAVFQMEEREFFKKVLSNELISNGRTSDITYYNEWRNEEKKLYDSLPELPFSNVWIAQQTANRLPETSEIHFGILNCLRMWNLFDTPKSVYGYSNVGGFGIDGCISSLIGASLANKDKLFFGVFGDLATFYDLNSLGNRHLGNNLRIMVINNGTGFEMRHRDNRGDVFNEDADILFAAAGHFGNKSRTVLKHFSEDLGFEYLSAENKNEYLNNLNYFIDFNMHDKPILFEVFIEESDENESYDLTQYVISDMSSTTKEKVKSILGEKNTQILKGILKR